jgi:hypothetical protein
VHHARHERGAHRWNASRGNDGGEDLRKQNKNKNCEEQRKKTKQKKTQSGKEWSGAMKWNVQEQARWCVCS